MVNDSRKIVEFCGIPGTGKTSIKTQLEEKYQGKVVSEIEIKKLIPNRNLKLVLFYIKPKNFVYFILTLLLLLRNIANTRQNFHFFVKILLMNFYKSQFISHKISKQYFFIDEGIIQALVSMWYNQEMKKSYMLKKILLYSYQNSNELICYCKIEEQTAKNRIRARNKMQGRLDKIKQDEELLKILKVQKENFLVILEMLKGKEIKIDTQQEIEKNLQILYKKVGEKSKNDT